MRPFAARGGAFARASKRGARSDAPKAPTPRKKRRAPRLESLQGDGKESPQGSAGRRAAPLAPGSAPPVRSIPSVHSNSLYRRHLVIIGTGRRNSQQCCLSPAQPANRRHFCARRTAGPPPGSPSSQRSRWAPKTSRSKSNANGRILGKRRANARKSPTEKGRRRDGLGSKAPRKKRKRNGNKKGVKESGSRGQANKKSRLNDRGDPTLDPTQQTGPMRNALRIRALRKKTPRRSRGRARIPLRRAELTSFRTAPTANP